jgi:hypothetical protein
MCQEKYGMTPMYDWALDYFGGRNVAKDFAMSSNIFWANGEYDPWHAGGVLEDVNPKNRVLMIE